MLSEREQGASYNLKKYSEKADCERILTSIPSRSEQFHQFNQNILRRAIDRYIFCGKIKSIRTKCAG
nr:MAG TPA: hypothetical protein [Caudoviricetes sp.]